MYTSIHNNYVPVNIFLCTGGEMAFKDRLKEIRKELSAEKLAIFMSSSQLGIGRER